MLVGRCTHYSQQMLTLVCKTYKDYGINNVHNKLYYTNIEGMWKRLVHACLGVGKKKA